MFSEISIILPALFAGILVLAVHVPLGFEVLKRGIIFIDLAIAQLAAMGAFFATLFFHGLEGSLVYMLLVQGLAFACALAGGLFFMYIEKRRKEIEETVIGCVFVLSATLILLALSQNAHAGEHLKDLLAGQLLFVSRPQIGLLGITSALSLFITRRFREQVSGRYFYMLFALVVTVSVQITGVYLVFATLIFPAAGVYYVKRYKTKLLLAYSGSFLGLAGSLLAALFFDLPAGPAIVWGIAAAMSAVFCAKSYQKIIKREV